MNDFIVENGVLTCVNVIVGNVGIVKQTLNLARLGASHSCFDLPQFVLAVFNLYQFYHIDTDEVHNADDDCFPKDTQAICIHKHHNHSIDCESYRIDNRRRKGCAIYCYNGFDGLDYHIHHIQNDEYPQKCVKIKFEPIVKIFHLFTLFLFLTFILYHKVFYLSIDFAKVFQKFFRPCGRPLRGGEVISSPRKREK